MKATVGTSHPRLTELMAGGSFAIRVLALGTCVWDVSVDTPMVN